VTENSAHVVDRARQLLQEWQDANLPRATTGLSADAQQHHSSVPLQQQPAVIAQQQCKQQQHRQHALSRTGLVSAQWLPPSSGRYKCNVDTAFSERFQRTSLGFVFVTSPTHLF